MPDQELSVCAGVRARYACPSRFTVQAAKVLAITDRLWFHGVLLNLYLLLTFFKLKHACATGNILGPYSGPVNNIRLWRIQNMDEFSEQRSFAGSTQLILSLIHI